jgi:predicted XRE-type DNA-binding protein
MARAANGAGDEPIEEGSGNVFADLGIPSPDEALLKAKLARAISEILSQRQLTQAEAARLLGIDQPKVSTLTRGRLAGFSVERLFRFLNALGRDVEIIVKETPETRDPQLSVIAS